MKYWYQTVIIRKRGKIPHWHVPNGLYFVTYRLAGSLPRHVEHEIALLRAQLLTARKEDFDSEEAREIERKIFKVTENELDQSRGDCWLRNEAVASIVMSSFDHEDGQDYELIALAVMPNHVHVMFRLNAELDAVIKRWKSYTAHEANAILKRDGSFWQSDYLDVLMRDSEQLQRTVEYVLNNPAKAGLRDWRYTRVWGERIVNLV